MDEVYGWYGRSTHPTDHRFVSANHAGQRLDVTASELIQLPRERQKLQAKTMARPYAEESTRMRHRPVRPAFKAAL